MKKILCFGDSNTFGFNPTNGKRYNENERWSGILKTMLKDCRIKELGCNNRTCFNNKGILNSIETLPNFIKDNEIAILQIGINDLQAPYNTTKEAFEEGLDKLISLIYKKIKIILLCPNKINECILKSYFNTLFDKNSIKLSKNLVEIYEKIGKKYGCTVIDLNKYAKTSQIDGLHFDISNHKIIAEVLCKTILE